MALVTVMGICVTAHAQTDDYRKTMCLAYVAVDDDTSTEEVIGYLEARYAKALETEDFILVMYLANDDEPMIVQVNTPYDNRGDFPTLVEAVRFGENHGVNPKYDVRRLTGLIESLDFLKQGTSQVIYRAVDWHFHVTSGFWEKGYNESLISTLCFVIGVEHFDTDNFRLRCYFSRNDDLVYDEEAPFGEKNYCNLEFMPYYY